MRRQTGRLLHERTAELAIGASTLRNQGAKRVVSASREFLKELDLGSFRAKSQEGFRARLNASTKRLRNRLPKGAKNWGAARKALNIFLRDVLYNHYLRSRHRFDRLERWLEVPLDRDVATALCREPEGGGLPRWRTIKRLTPKLSCRYQTVALEVARRKGTERVHLDLYYWRRRQNASEA